MFREFHWQNGYQTFVSEQHSRMDCFTVSCFTEDCWLLTLHSYPVFWVFFLNLNSWNSIQFNFFVFLFDNTHNCLYTLEQLLYYHTPWIFSLVLGCDFFSFIQLLIYERTFSEFVHESCLLCNLQCMIVFQWKWIFRGLYSVFCIFVFWNIRYIQPFKEMWREETLIKILERCFFLS